MKKFFEICDVSRWIPDIKFSYTKIFDIDMLSKLFNISKSIKYSKLLLSSFPLPNFVFFKLFFRTINF